MTLLKLGTALENYYVACSVLRPSGFKFTYLASVDRLHEMVEVDWLDQMQIKSGIHHESLDFGQSISGQRDQENLGSGRICP